MVEFKEYEGLGYFIDPESDTKQVFIPSPPTMATVKINPRPGIIYVTGGKVKEGYEQLEALKDYAEKIKLEFSVRLLWRQKRSLRHISISKKAEKC